jgi:hypothetical protein
MTTATTQQFWLEWGDPALKLEIRDRLRALGRQTMNLRIMPGARVLALWTADRKALVGWCGLDHEFSPSHPEVFSLHLYPEWRLRQLGVVLETARAKVLLKNGFKFAYGRMEESTNHELLKYRIATGMFVQLAAFDLPDPIRAACNQCELYRTSCTAQAFIALDLHNIVSRGEDRVGIIDVDHLPQVIRLAELRPSHTMSGAEP